MAPISVAPVSLAPMLTPTRVFAPTVAKRQPRIVHVTDFYLPRVGGIERHVSDLAAVQRAAGYDVDVITVDGLVESNERALDTNRRPTSSMAGWSPQAMRTARAVILAGGYDIVHVHVSLATPMSFSVVAAASRRGIPTVVTMHSLVGGVGSILRVLGTPVNWQHWPVAWTAVSSAAAIELQRALGSRRQVGVLSNAIDVERWRLNSPTPHGDVHIVAVMRLTRRKRSMELLHILRSLRASTPHDIPVRVTIIGDGSCRSAMERFLARNEMDSWVHLVGRRDHHQISAIFDAADVFVAPATRESFGIAALEARAAGLPIVAMRCSGISEFVDDGVSGLLADDDHGMVEALRRLAVDAVGRNRIAEHNRTNPPPFDWGSALRAVDDVYSTATMLQVPEPRCITIAHSAAAVGG